jgi:hypothetical protein
MNYYQRHKQGWGEDLYSELAPYKDLLIDRSRGVAIRDLTFRAAIEQTIEVKLASGFGQKSTPNTFIQTFKKPEKEHVTILTRLGVLLDSNDEYSLLDLARLRCEFAQGPGGQDYPASVSAWSHLRLLNMDGEVQRIEPAANRLGWPLIVKENFWPTLKVEGPIRAPMNLVFTFTGYDMTLPGVDE